MVEGFMIKRLLTPIPIGVVLVDLIYGFAVNVSQGLDLQSTAKSADGTIAVTPDIAFNSLQIVANGGMVAIIGFGLAVLFRLNRSVLLGQVLVIGVFRTLGLLAVLAFSVPSLWEWGHALYALAEGRSVLNAANGRYLLTALCMPLIAILCIVRLFQWCILYRRAGAGNVVSESKTAGL